MWLIDFSTKLFSYSSLLPETTIIKFNVFLNFALLRSLGGLIIIFKENKANSYLKYIRKDHFWSLTLQLCFAASYKAWLLHQIVFTFFNQLDFNSESWNVLHVATMCCKKDVLLEKVSTQSFFALEILKKNTKKLKCDLFIKVSDTSAKGVVMVQSAKTVSLSQQLLLSKYTNDRMDFPKITKLVEYFI